MINNLGNNGEALQILRTESKLIEIPNEISGITVFNLGQYIDEVQSEFNGKQVTKVHLKAVKEVGSPINSQALGLYALDGFNISFADIPFPPYPTLKKSRVFIINNNEEIEFFGKTNFNGVSIIPIYDGALVASNGYILQPPSEVAINPPVLSFRLQITLMGL